MEMLDEEHQSLPQSSGDTNIYNLGSINGHNVVIAGLPRAGNNPAATVVTQMRMTFPNLKYGLLVGIGGGVPRETKSGMIRLGHVVVSEPTGIHSGAVQYDHGKAILGRFQRKGFLAPPPTALLNAAREMAVRRQRMDHDPIRENLQRIKVNNRMLDSFKFPGTANDHLYPSNYEHQQTGAPCEGGCDPKRRIKRSVEEDDSYIVLIFGLTWNISYNYIKRESPNAAMLLRQWAYFDNKDLCHGLVAADSPIASRQVESQGYSMHGRVHSWIIHGLNSEFDMGMALTAMKCVALHVPDRNQREFWITQRRLIAHADRLLREKEILEVMDKALDALLPLGSLYQNQGRLLEANMLFMRALEGYERKLGLEHPITLQVVDSLATVYAEQGWLVEAEAMYARALQSQKKAWGPEHILTLNTVNNLGLLYILQGRITEAQTMLERALKGKEKAWGPEHISTLNTISNLGMLHRYQGQLTKAESMYTRALQGYEKALGPMHRSTLGTVKTLGALYAEQGRFAEAEVMSKRALQSHKNA
ncbi:Disease resistance protein [Penicillium frequentans]|uniref:Disease resistance protein n=1 Tax=Penicillium frequentans TaxID=3151616 RepID=A0AAD6GID6_9EURO|nr:Disease resistance protein [Penicillium glabrum]